MADSIFLGGGGGAASSVVFPGGSEFEGETANQVDLVNGTNGQLLRIYRTQSGPNAEWLDVGWDSDDAIVRSGASGTGTARNVYLGVGASLWLVNSDNDLVTAIDGAVDIGGAAGSRPDTINAASNITVAGAPLMRTLANGQKEARGAIALDGSNPTPVATGLATIVSATATVQRTSAVSTGTAFVTVDFTGANGTLNLYAWILAGTASTGTEVVNWIAIGT